MPTADMRELGSFGNPGFGNRNIVKGCDRIGELVLRWIKIGLAFSCLMDQKRIGENTD